MRKQKVPITIVYYLLLNWEEKNDYENFYTNSISITVKNHKHERNDNECEGSCEQGECRFKNNGSINDIYRGFYDFDSKL